MPDIAEQIDAAIGAAPPDGASLDTTVFLGRRALRRRRLAYAAGAVTTAVVIGGGAWAVAGGGGSNDARDDTSIAEESEQEQPAAAEPWGRDELVRVGEDGKPEVNPGAEILQTSDISVGDRPAHIWVLRLDGKDHYVLAERDGSVSSSPAGVQGLDVGEWATQQLDPDSVLPADDAWVSFEGGSDLVALPGVRIVQQLPDPGLGANFARPGVPTAVAEVVRGGTTYFLAVRAFSGSAEAIPYRQDRKIRTFAEFVAYAEKQYATNDEGGSEGMR